MLPSAVECSAVVLVYFSKSSCQFYGGKRKWGRCSFKRVYWVGLIWVSGEGSLRLAPALVFCNPSPPPLCPAVCPHDEKAGSAHMVQFSPLG